MIAIAELFFVEVVFHQAVNVHWLLPDSCLSASSLISRRGKLILSKIKGVLQEIVVFLLRILRERFVTQEARRLVDSSHFLELSYLLERLRLHLAVVDFVRLAVLLRSVHSRLVTSVCLHHSCSGTRLCGSWLPLEELVRLGLQFLLQLFRRSVEGLAVLPCKLHIQFNVICTLTVLDRPLCVQLRPRSGALTLLDGHVVARFCVLVFN